LHLIFKECYRLTNRKLDKAFRHAKITDNYWDCNYLCRIALAVADQNTLWPFAGRYNNRQAGFKILFSTNYYDSAQHYYFSDYMDFPEVKTTK